jgi:hypothetical protein
MLQTQFKIQSIIHQKSIGNVATYQSIYSSSARTSRNIETSPLHQLRSVLFISEHLVSTLLIQIELDTQLTIAKLINNIATYKQYFGNIQNIILATSNLFHLIYFIMLVISEYLIYTLVI